MLFSHKRLWEIVLNVWNRVSHPRFVPDTCSLPFLLPGQVKKVANICFGIYFEPITKYLPNNWASFVKTFTEYLESLNFQTEHSLPITKMTIPLAFTQGEWGSRVQYNEREMADWSNSAPTTNSLCNVRRASRLCWILVPSPANWVD